jgi:hypothetical protein
LRRAPASFAGDQLVAAADSPDDQGLNDSARANRLSQFIESGLREPGSRLVRAGVKQIDIEQQGTASDR